MYNLLVIFMSTITKEYLKLNRAATNGSYLNDEYSHNHFRITVVSHYVTEAYLNFFDNTLDFPIANIC